MISVGNKRRGNKRRGNKRTKHRASIPGSTPKPESAISALQRFAELARQERHAWLRRPRIAPWELVDPSDDLLETPEEIAERAGKENELAKKLSWEPERLARFRQLVLSYEKHPTSANYLQIRRDFPEAEVKVAYLGGLGALCNHAEKFAGQGIDPMLFKVDLAHEPNIDALCLHLLELLVT